MDNPGVIFHTITIFTERSSMKKLSSIAVILNEDYGDECK
jgi:hypothetical protein